MTRSDRIVLDTGKHATIAGYLWTQHQKEISHIEQIANFLNLALSKETEAGQMPDSLRLKLTDMASCIAGYFGMDYLAMISQNHEECHDSTLFEDIKKLKRRMIIQGLDGSELSETEMLSVINKIISMYTSSMYCYIISVLLLNRSRTNRNQICHRESEDLKEEGQEVIDIIVTL